MRGILLEPLLPDFIDDLITDVFFHFGLFFVVRLVPCWTSLHLLCSLSTSFAHHAKLGSFIGHGRMCEWSRCCALRGSRRPLGSCQIRMSPIKTRSALCEASAAPSPGPCLAILTYMSHSWSGCLARTFLGEPTRKTMNNHELPCVLLPHKRQSRFTEMEWRKLRIFEIRKNRKHRNSRILEITSRKIRDLWNS